MKNLVFEADINNEGSTGLINLESNSVFCFCTKEAADEILASFNKTGSNLDLEKMDKQADELLKNATKEDFEKFLKKDRVLSNGEEVDLDELYEQFAPNHIALALKKKGFNKHCFGYWENNTLDPNCPKLIICSSNLPLIGEQLKRPGLYETSNKNSKLPQWAASAPTYDQIVRWFKKKHKIIISIVFYCDGDNWEDVEYKVEVSEYKHFKTHDSFVKSGFNNYHTALNKGIEETLKLI